MLYAIKNKQRYFETLFATSKRQIIMRTYVYPGWMLSTLTFSLRHADYLPLLLGQPFVSEMASAKPFQKAGFLAVGHSSNAKSGPYKHIHMYMSSARVSCTTQGRF